MSTPAISKPVPIQDFVAELKKFPEPAFSRIDQIIRFLQHTPVLPDTLAPYLTWDKQHYTRNLIDKTPLYELVAICWEIGQSSSIHNPREFNQRAVSLHVYSRPFDTCVVYSQEQGTCGVIKLHYQTEYGKPAKN